MQDCVDFCYCISRGFVFSTRNNTLENINILISALTKDIAVALISFLGFTVSGLAILTGVISKKEVQTVMRARKN